MSLTRNAYPIRLTQENGNITELMATHMDMNVTRKIGAKPVPFKGSSRFGLDMNLNQSTIVIQGFFADDGENVNVAKAASAKVDFAVSSSGGYFLTKLNMLAASGASSSATDENAQPVNNSVVNFLHLPTQTGVIRTISLKFLTGTTVINSGGVYAAHTGSDTFVSVHYDNLTNYSVNTEAVWLTQTQQFATAITACINASANNHFTASVVNGNRPDLSIATNCAVNIVQNTSGVMPKTEIAADVRESNNVYDTPSRTNFTGGAGAIQKSAGDKAMDMYGVLNNSKRNSKARNILAGAAAVAGISVAVIATGGLVAGGVGAGTALAGGGTMIGGAGVVGAAAGRLANQFGGYTQGDYYIGLQIPYNSMIQTSDGSYVARNFTMPVGSFITEGDTNEPFGQKGSEYNTQPANVAFSERDWTTGIQGSIEKLDISYDAGEQIYLYNLVFKAIDLML